MKTLLAHFLAPLFVVAFVLLFGSPILQAAQVIAPTNGFGTTIMPPAGEDYDGGQMQIVAGLPPGTTVDINNPVYGNFGFITEGPGGTFAGGTRSTNFADLVLPMTGTGALTGYSRTITLINMPGTMDFDLRVPFAPVQSFDADLRLLQGQLPPGDPDFDLLRITAGTDFGLPSPGHTTLTAIGGGNWNVDSFFDITYRIDFVGHPGGPFGGLSGSTTGTSHFQMGMPTPEPSTWVLAMVGGAGLVGAALRRRS